MSSALLIANPAASQFTGGLHRSAMRTLARSHDIRAIWPQSAEHSRIAARDAARSGVGLVIAMGGDGIVHHVAQGLADTEGVLGIIPAGTTNVVGRLVGVPHRPKDAIRMLADDHGTIEAPTVEVHGDGPDDGWTARAVFSLGVGPDALVVAAAETEPYRKYRFGSIHYARTAVGTVWRDLRKQKPDLTVSTHTTRRGIGAMVQFHSAYTYFGRVPLRLDSQDPAPMSVLTIERLPLRRAPAILRRAASGSLDRVKGLHLDRGVDSFTIEADVAVQVQMDGEHYGTVRRLTALSRPASLRIAVPR
ncbi:MAG: diacylglycerol/lipid kinase family protein [Acidimicrobiia bacterium]